VCWGKCYAVIANVRGYFAETEGGVHLIGCKGCIALCADLGQHATAARNSYVNTRYAHVPLVSPIVLSDDIVGKVEGLEARQERMQRRSATFLETIQDPPARSM
jgi:hypothetical protein